MDGEKIFVKISGYIDFDVELNGKIPGDTLANYKSNFNAEDSIKKDLCYRCDIGEDTFFNISDFDEGYEEEAFQTWVYQYLKSEIENGQIAILEVEFSPYYENGNFEGWDYITTLKIDWETLWNRWNKRNEI